MSVVVPSPDFLLFLDLHRQSAALLKARGGTPGDCRETDEEIVLNGRIARQWGELSREDQAIWLRDYRDNGSWLESIR